MNVSDAEIMDISSTHDEVLDEAPPLDEVEQTCVPMSSTIGTQYEVALEENGDTRSAMIIAVDFLAEQIGARGFQSDVF